jgi:hypothetical protein
MTASDSRGSKSRLTTELTLRDAIGPPPVSFTANHAKMIKAPALSRPLVFAWFHFSTWRVPKADQGLVRLRKGGRPVTS